MRKILRSSSRERNEISFGLTFLNIKKSKKVLTFWMRMIKIINVAGNKSCEQNVRVAQLDRATGYGPVGRGFESCRARVEMLLSRDA